MAKKKHEIFIGTSGWSYDHWKDNFYPEGLKTSDWLEFYSEEFPTVEINTTFYHTPKESVVKHWKKIVPKEFLFSIKASRYITHQKRLHECERSLEYFYASIKNFGTKAGPILFQLPPSFPNNEERLIDFISLLKKKYRYVFEFRHESWFVSDIYKILEDHNIALCITDLNGKQTPEIVTADFTYLRLHGPHKAYQGSYGAVKLKALKKKIEKWKQEASVFCYFDNDEKGYAIQDAKNLQKYISK